MTVKSLNAYLTHDSNRWTNSDMTCDVLPLCMVLTAIQLDECDWL